MVLKFFLFAIIVLLISCSVPERDNPYDPDGVNYIGNQLSSSSQVELSSSSAVEPPLSSATSVSSSSSVAKSSSSAKVSSSSSVPSSSSVVSSSSSVVVAVSCDMNYGTVPIGDQVWMAENLNCDVSGSKCYDNSDANCATYGRLYDWETAMNLPGCNSKSCASQIGTPHRGICPSGWHIPSDEDWKKLINYVESSNGCSNCAARYLKADNGWDSNGNGNDKYGFSALPGGYGNSDGSFGNVGNFGFWRSASEYTSYGAYSRDMDYLDEGVLYSHYDKSYLLSVRCLQD
jgi:uncharacterized protein (TIGR02145 family)